MKQYYQIILLLFISIPSYGTCPLAPWIQSQEKESQQLEFYLYDFPLPDQNSLFIRETLPTRKIQQNLFIFNPSSQEIWIEQGDFNCNSKPSIIYSTTTNQNFKQIITNEVKLIFDFFNSWNLQPRINAIFVVDELKKRGSYNPKFQFVLIKFISSDFLSVKTLIHEIGHGLKTSNPSWVSEGVSEFFSLQYLKQHLQFASKSQQHEKQLISEKFQDKYKQASLKNWEGKWKYEKAFYTIHMIYQWLGRKKFIKWLSEYPNYPLTRELSQSQANRLTELLQ